MDMIAVALLSSAAILAVAFKRLADPPLLALALTHLLQLSGSMQWAVRQTTEAENHMTSVERLLAYTALPQERGEAAEGQVSRAVAKGWPATAELRFEAVEVLFLFFCVLGRSACSRTCARHALRLFDAVPDSATQALVDNNSLISCRRGTGPACRSCSRA